MMKPVEIKKIKYKKEREKEKNNIGPYIQPY